MTCKTCFDDNLEPHLLVEQSIAVSIERVREPILKALITFTCIHGRTHKHTVYPANTELWMWCEFKTNDWQWSGLPAAPEKAA